MLAMTIVDGALAPAQVPTPEPGAGQVLIKVAAAGLNRADLLQMRGRHPVPEGAPAWPGLEASGVIEAVGDGVTGWAVGDRVTALLDGGGYAEYVLARAADLIGVPDGVDLVEAGGLPEALLTMWSNLVDAAGLSPEDNTGRTVLVHGGSGGVGSTAIQWLRATGAVVFATAGGPERVAGVHELGAFGIDHRTEDFVEIVRDATGGRGVDVILDVVGGPYLRRNIEALAPRGHLAIIGLQQGGVGEIDLGPVLFRWLTITGTVLRGRAPAEKAALTDAVTRHAMPLVVTGQISPLVTRTFPLADAAEAHRALRNGEIFGKALLIP